MTEDTGSWPVGSSDFSRSVDSSTLEHLPLFEAPWADRAPAAAKVTALVLIAAGGATVYLLATAKPNSPTVLNQPTKAREIREILPVHNRGFRLRRSGSKNTKGSVASHLILEGHHHVIVARMTRTFAG